MYRTWLLALSARPIMPHMGTIVYRVVTMPCAMSTVRNMVQPLLSEQP